MSRRNQQQDAKGIFPEIPRARADMASAELVEKGIALQEIRGTPYAAIFLKSQWISLDVALRVLSRRSLHRNGHFIAR